MSEYQVVPFIGKIKGKQTATDVSKQLEILINEREKNGMEFVQLGAVNIEVQPGCLGGLLGASETYTRFDMAIFKRKG
jgi:hypothetical protein